MKTTKGKLALAISILCLGGLGIGSYLFKQHREQIDNDKIIADIVASEEFIESQRKPLKNLAIAWMTSAEPADVVSSMFSNNFQGNQLEKRLAQIPLEITKGKITPWQANSNLETFDQGKGWKPFEAAFTGNEDFDFIKVYIVRGHAQDDGSYYSQINVQGRSRPSKESPWRAFKSKHDVTWEMGSAAKILTWKIVSFEEFSTPVRIYENVTDTAIPHQSTRNEVLKSELEEYFINGIQGKPVSLYRTQTHLAKYLDRDALTLHPGLSVVDYDGDGWEDLYLTVRLGRNILLRNQGDGTFKDTTVEARLAVPGLSNAALFADFDNDGDPDLFLGRVLKPSLYFRNDQGVFTECSGEVFSSPLPQLANSITAVDYNQDGLLDIYVSTYGMFGTSPQAVLEANRPFMSEEAFMEYSKRFKTAHRYLNMVGPPNVLFVNRGEKGFELAPENDDLQFYYNSFQASWSDYDDDGDPDFYLANDFAPDLLIRNDGKDKHGKIRFTNVTNEVGHSAMLGFGMGVDWGDYDRDGKEDLYVSNMFSKAGLRITEQVPGLDPRFHQSAEGNRLYRFNGKTFQLTSYPASDGHPVNQAGWSWGGQFLDANNDGWLDIYTANGHYTAPPELTNESDG